MFLLPKKNNYIIAIFSLLFYSQYFLQFVNATDKTKTKTCLTISPTSKYDCLAFQTNDTSCCFVTGYSYVNKVKQAEQKCYQIPTVNLTDLLPEVIYITTLVTGVKPEVICHSKYINNISFYFLLIFYYIVIIG